MSIGIKYNITRVKTKPKVECCPKDECCSFSMCGLMTRIWHFLDIQGEKANDTNQTSDNILSGIFGKPNAGNISLVQKIPYCCCFKAQMLSLDHLEINLHNHSIKSYVPLCSCFCCKRYVVQKGNEGKHIGTIFIKKACILPTCSYLSIQDSEGVQQFHVIRPCCNGNQGWSITDQKGQVLSHAYITGGCDCFCFQCGSKELAVQLPDRSDDQKLLIMSSMMYLL